MFAPKISKVGERGSLEKLQLKKDILIACIHRNGAVIIPRGKDIIKVGDTVAANQEIVVLEAMKMETPVYAPVAGTVTAINVKEQDSVSEGQVLLTIG